MVQPVSKRHPQFAQEGDHAEDLGLMTKRAVQRQEQLLGLTQTTKPSGDDEEIKQTPSKVGAHPSFARFNKQHSELKQGTDYEPEEDSRGDEDESCEEESDDRQEHGRRSRK
jgi:hypothetical protein